ncbi:HAMP domain-containing histidine kinase [Deefgea sp. H3-26]|uniref:histidine kinase n=1 Tax=Deefgea salmonis TaxID=2875502 RepID=A0ABS8BGT5_9NEIS|nr:HAMP domain-containing sensor histidine kinase [uncultured Deefgea sp.]MCB5194811.1 HAMP domain-containing histidine kinase [Deefgea salmonis]
MTIVLTVSGAFSYYRTQAQLEHELSEFKQSLTIQLQNVLPGVMWNFDDQQLALILNAEMRSPDIHSIEIFSTDAFVTGRIRENNKITTLNAPITQLGPETDTTEIYYEKKAIGKLVVTISRQRIDQLLRQMVLEKILEIVLLDALLMLTLTTVLQHFVISPLSLLGKKLSQAANSDKDLESIELPNNPYKEFSVLTDGFGRIIKRLKEDVAIRSQAEQQMRTAKEDAETALDQLKDAQTSLIQSEKMASLGGLVAGIAHEINTPVGIILTSASVLHDDSVLFSAKVESGNMKKSEVVSYSQTAEQSSALIISNAVRAAELIQSFKRVAVDQTSEARRDFELSQYLHETVTSISPALKHSQISILIDCPNEIDMEGYPGAISQIISNLINNAALHAFSGIPNSGEIKKQVHIIAEQHQQNVSLKVKDNGQGIDGSVIGKIFDPFYTTKRANGGSGLGLNIVFNLVTQTLGGHINVESIVDQGTIFSMTFPLIAPKHKETNEANA